jgi:hypothetical protein
MTMPCYTREKSTIEFGPKTDAKLLAAAFKTLGYDVLVSPKGVVTFYGEQIEGRFANGKLSVNSATVIDEKMVNTFKRAYSAEVVKSAAQRFGWQVKQPSANTFQVQRRF